VLLLCCYRRYAIATDFSACHAQVFATDAVVAYALAFDFFTEQALFHFRFSLKGFQRPMSPPA
jgi:hypothetical protein